MIDFIDYHKGKIISIIADILLLIWWLPWHYYRLKYMLINNYDMYMIWDDIGGRLFFTIFAIGVIIAAGYIIDLMSNGGY